MRSKKIVFFFPAFSSQEATAPLGILAVSTPLLRAGYNVRIIDSTITPNFQDVVLAEMEDAICLAVSLVTGPMIRETIQVAKAVKTPISRQARRVRRMASVPSSRSDVGSTVRRRCREGTGRGCVPRDRSAHRGG